MTISDEEREFWANEENESSYGRGSSVAPAINTVIIGMAPGVGLWEIVAMGRYGAVADVADNFELMVAGNSQGLLPVAGVANGIGMPIVLRKRLTSVVHQIQIRNPVAGVATSVYLANLTLRKLAD